MKVKPITKTLEALQYDGTRDKGDAIIQLTKDSETPASWNVENSSNDFTVDVKDGQSWSVTKNQNLQIQRVQSSKKVPVEIGDWIVQGNKNVFYSLSDKQFKETFEVIPEEPKQTSKNKLKP